MESMKLLVAREEGRVGLVELVGSAEFAGPQQVDRTLRWSGGLSLRPHSPADFRLVNTASQQHQHQPVG